MGREWFDCQICSFQFPTVISFKQHLCSVRHRQQYERVYPNDIFKRNRKSYTPWIFNKDKGYFLKNNLSEPVLGLSQMTLCFCSEYGYGLYLCHVCQELFHTHNVVVHMFEGNHYSNYFAYTDPNAVSFCSVQSKHISMMENVKKEQEKRGTGKLQALHIPERLFKECTNKNYCQVMFLLYQNKSLSHIFKKSNPERMTIQMYKDDLTRKHPLLGLNNIVECICTPHVHLRHYLCTLCSLHVSSIIRHLLSFEHIFAYLNTWHPSTLKAKECYIKGSPDVACILADFARQAEKLQELPNEIQQVRVDTSQMLSVLNVRFREALSKIESIANKGSLIPTVKPGKKLEPTIPTNVKQESMSEPVTSGNSTLIQNIKEEYEESTTEPNATPAAPSYNFHCQNCSENFETNGHYCLHLSRSEHWENLEKTFGPVMDKHRSECRPHFYSYKYFTDQDILCVGVSLVVTVLSHQRSDEPVHLCFACETAFQRHFLKFHMNSEKHVILSLMYQNPWKLPFAWRGKLDDLTFRLQAWIKEGETGPTQNIRILDVPPHLFPSAPPLNYSKVMEKLSQYHPLLMNGVPRRETYSKLQGNDRFPILGRNFLVKYGQIASGWKFLCLLCQRPLSSDDYTAHVFSWEHVVAFLETFHPGSLDLNTTNEEVLLDLAKQAARIHPVANAQEIEFDSYQQKCDFMDFKTMVRRLSLRKATDGKGPLIPSISPKNILFPRQQAQEQNLDTKTNESNTVTKIQSIPRTAVEKLVDGFQSTEQEPHVQINQPMDISLQETNNFPNEKEVKEENNPMNPSEPSQLEEIKSAKSSSCKSVMSTALKTQRRLLDMDTSDSETENVEPKRMCLSNPEEKKEMANLQNIDQTKPCTSSRTVDNSVPCTGRELLSHIQRRIRNPLIGLSVIYECVCNDRTPIYLCDCCHLIFKELHITKHLSETWHYYCYLIRAGEQTPETNDKYWKYNTARLAAFWEKKEGCGKAQVVKLMPNDYERLALTEQYNEALKIVKTHLARKITKITWSPTLQEDSSRIVTISRKETSQQDMHMEIDPKPVATSLETKIPSTNEIPSKSLKETNLSGTPDLKQSAVHATIDRDTSTAPTPFSSSLLKNDNSSAKTMDESESTNIAEDTSNATCTEAAKSSKSLCRFIMTRAIIPEVESKTINTPENTSDKIPYAMPHCFTTTGTPGPTARRVCNFMTAKSATRSMPTPAMTHLTATIAPASTCNSGIVTSNTEQMTSAMEAYKVTDCTPISDVAASNAVKGAPNPQDKSILPNAAIGSESISEVAMLDNNHLSDKKAATKSSSSDTHAKSKGIQLKLNTNAVSHVKNDDLVLESGPLTPTTPISCPPKPTAGISQKPPAEGLEIGLNHLVKVKCEKRSFVLCFACLTKLEASNHVTSTDHHINCVKVKFPSWSGKPGDEELSKMLARLHDEEKASKVEAMTIKVSFDVYKVLKGLPLDKALEKVGRMRKTKLRQRQPSASANEALNSSTSTHSSVSPCDITSSDLRNGNSQANPQMSIAQPIKQLPVAAPSPSPPVQKPTSKVAPWIIKGSTTDDISNLSHILSVKGTSVIGLCLVWECRVVPPSHSSFYLCESCSRIISLNDICDHMRSTEHHSEYLKRQYPQFMYWTREELHPWMKKELTDYIADLVKCREVSMDAQTVLLSEECFELVRDASFVKALNVVQRIKQEKKTTTLPLIVLSQQEVDPREQQRTQLTLDTSNTLTDLANQMDISITETTGEITESDLTQHESSSAGNTASVNAESCISPTDTDNTTAPQMTEALDSQSPAITNSPKQPDEPADSASNQNSAVSPKDEKQECFDPDIKACFDIASPLSSDDSAVSPVINTTEISAGTLKDASTDIKLEPDVQHQPGSASVEETSKVSPNLSEDNITTALVEEQMTEECSPHSHSDANRESSFHMLSSTVDHNANESPPPDPEEKAALDKHYCLLLIDFLKKAKHNMQHSRNQTSEPYTTKSPESNEEECKPPPPPKKNTDKPVSVNVLSDNLNKTIVSHSVTQQLKDDEPEAESKVLKQLQLPKIQVQQKESKLKQVKTKDNASDSQISVQTSQLEIQVIQTGSQYHSAVHSEIQQSLCQASQQIKPRLNSDTQKASSRCPPHMSSSLLQSDSGAVQLQTQQNQVQVLQQTRNHELPLLSPTWMTQFQNTPQQSQQMQVSQVHLQTPVEPLQHVTQLTQGQTAQPIESLVSPTSHDTMYFRRYANQQNTNFQVTQGPPLSYAATLPVTSDTTVVTGERSQFVQTAYLTNADYSNTQAQFGIPHGSAYPEHFYHQLQTQHFTSMQAFLQNVQSPDFSRCFNPNTQLQPVAQNSPARTNTIVGGTCNAAYSNAVSFNTGNNQSYTYTHNSVQEYNRVVMQNLVYTPSFAPTQTNPQFFPPRQ